jgi:hypothetical protein
MGFAGWANPAVLSPAISIGIVRYEPPKIILRLAFFPTGATLPDHKEVWCVEHA